MTYRLRPVQEGDAEAVLDAFVSAPDMARQGDVKDLASAHEYVEWLRGQARRAFAITHGDRLVGLVAVVVDDLNRNGWVFYWLHAAHRGRGVTARATATVADWALGDGAHGGGLERLELGHRVNNPASGGVALAAGFVPEGRERGKFLVHGERVDVLTYGRLRTDPAPTTEHLALRPVRTGGLAARGCQTLHTADQPSTDLLASAPGSARPEGPATRTA